MAKQRKRKPRPLCKSHWRKVRQEALAVVPFWSRPLAGFKVNRMLQEKGFERTEGECVFCKVESRG